MVDKNVKTVTTLTPVKLLGLNAADKLAVKDVVDFATAAQGTVADSALQPGAVREKLTANRTYYVRSDGSDSNTGLANTSGGAFLTIQKAVDVAVSLDLSLYLINIQCDAATRTSSIVLKSYIGIGPISIIGDAVTPSNCVISTTSASCFTGTDVGRWTVQGFKIQTTTSGEGFFIIGKSDLTLKNIDYGVMASGGSHHAIYNGARVNRTAGFTISGGGYNHIAAVNGYFTSAGMAGVITGTPAFSNAYVNISRGSGATITDTYTGTATGKLYDVSLNSWLLSGGTTMPGNSAGSTATGGQYA